MKVAIPLFQNRVSPRFEFAPTLLVATVENNRVLEKKEISLKRYNLFQRSSLLRELGVNTLICGGIQGFIAQSLNVTKVQVISLISGEAEEVLQRFLEGKLYPSFPFFPIQRQRRCRNHNQLTCGRRRARGKIIS